PCGACHRAGHFGPDPLAWSPSPAARGRMPETPRSFICDSPAQGGGSRSVGVDSMQPSQYSSCLRLTRLPVCRTTNDHSRENAMAMSFELSEEHRMLRDLVKKFVDDELMPLEKTILEREATGKGAG